MSFPAQVLPNRPRVMILQNLEVGHPGLIATELAALGCEVEVRRVDQRGVPAQIAPEWDALVVMGGVEGVYDAPQHPWIDAEIALLRAALAAGLPTLGVCLGAQMLAAAAGFPVYKHRALPEIGWHPVRITDAGQADPLLGAFAGGSGEATVFQWHQDTFDLSPEVPALARSDGYPNQAFRIGPCAWGIQFHFEITAEIPALWAENDAKGLAETGQEAATLISGAQFHLAPMQARSRTLLAAFATWVRGTGAQASAMPLPANTATG